LFFGGLFVLCIYVAVDAHQFSPLEWKSSFANENTKHLFFWAPVWYFCCLAGAGYCVLYFLWARPRLRRSAAQWREKPDAQGV
jgi:hypothetical protein